MFSFKWRSQSLKTMGLSIFIILLSWGLVSCRDRLEPPKLPSSNPSAISISAGKLAEVAPPDAIQQLNQSLDQYQPQVSIVTPQADQLFQQTTVSVEIEVRDLPIFQDADLGLGPHLQLILDNEPGQAIYNSDRPLVLEDLTPGTHTLRVFAVRPWQESFKNDGAYAQTTFHVFTKTEANAPNPALPLLTYNSPQGSYGAEPIMLDFYLTNAPLRLVAQETSDKTLSDWRIRATINGQSFLLDSWQTIFLKGFDKGQNWIKLEFLDQQGNTVNNTFNNTVRLITYNPKEQDSLSQLIRGEIPAEVARSIVNPNYQAEPIPLPSPVVAPTPSLREEPPIPEPESTPEETIQSSEEPTSPVTEFFPRKKDTQATEEPTPVATPLPEMLPSIIEKESPTVTPLPEAIEVPPVLESRSPEKIPLAENQPAKIDLQLPAEEIQPPVEDKPILSPEAATERITNLGIPDEEVELPSLNLPPPMKEIPFKKPQWLDNALERFQEIKPETKIPQ